MSVDDSNLLLNQIVWSQESKWIIEFYNQFYLIWSDVVTLYKAALSSLEIFPLTERLDNVTYLNELSSCLTGITDVMGL